MAYYEATAEFTKEDGEVTVTFSNGYSAIFEEYFDEDSYNEELAAAYEEITGEEYDEFDYDEDAYEEACEQIDKEDYYLTAAVMEDADGNQICATDYGDSGFEEGFEWNFDIDDDEYHIECFLKKEPCKNISKNNEDKSER